MSPAVTARAANVRASTLTSARRGSVRPGAARRVSRAARAASPPIYGAGAAHHQTLGHRLAHEPPTRGTERKTDRHFTQPSDGPGQHETGEVDCRHQEHQSNQTRDEHQLIADRPDDFILQRVRDERAAGVGVWILTGQTLPDGRDCRVCAVDRHARRQFSDPAKRADRAARRQRMLARQWHEDVRVHRQNIDTEAGRRDADNSCAPRRSAAARVRQCPPARRDAARARSQSSRPAGCPLRCR